MSVLDPRLLFMPRSVAVIGASANPAGHAGRALSNLVRTGFSGAVYPVNPKYDELLGLPCYPDVRATPEPPRWSMSCSRPRLRSRRCAAAGRSA